MNESEYNVYSEFNLEKHKKVYKNYLEVIILPTGKVVYAVPSHTEKIVAIAMQKYKCTRREILDRCPREYYFDFITWLVRITGTVSVWNDFCISYNPNKRQINKLIKLKESGVYFGKIPVHEV